MVAATVLGSGMAAIDATVVGIALPTIGRDFHTTLATLQWVVTGYTLTLGSLLLVGGTLGDRYGRRRLFTVGVVWFVATSAAAGVAPDAGVLVVMRVLQGVGAALLTPGSLAIIQASFVPDDTGEAIGAWSGLSGLANAAGPLVGGYLIVAASWRWIFFLNLPLGAVVLVLTARHVPESVDPAATGRPDLAGGALAVLGLGGLAYGLIDGPQSGWSDPAVVAALAAGLGALAGLVVAERVASAPMLPPWLFRRRQFVAANAVTFVVYAALGGALFLLPVALQVVDGYSPLESGVALVPVTVLMLVLSARSGRLAAAIGPRLQMSVGPLLVGAGLVLLTRLVGDRWYPTGVLPGMAVFGLGLAVTVAPLTATAIGAVPPEHAGLSSAVNNAVARVGGLIAVAVLPAVGGIVGRSYLHPAALAAGFRTTLWVAAAACAVGGGLAAAGIRNPPQEASGASGRPARPYRYCALEGPPPADAGPGAGVDPASGGAGAGDAGLRGSRVPRPARRRRPPPAPTG